MAASADMVVTTEEEVVEWRAGWTAGAVGDAGPRAAAATGVVGELAVASVTAIASATATVSARSAVLFCRTCTRAREVTMAAPQYLGGATRVFLYA
jgi:hypothetical protein